MRMDDAVSIGKFEGGPQSQADFDPSTRILRHLTSDGLEPATSWQIELSIAGEGPFFA